MTQPVTPPTPGPDPSNTPVETLLAPLDHGDTAVTDLTTIASHDSDADTTT